ncbi:MAG: 3D domain-containing protein, partial [Thermotogota bacterium]
SLTSIETGGDASSSTVVGKKVQNIEEEINSLKNEISNIKNNQEDIYILNKISEINERLDDLENGGYSSKAEYNKEDIKKIIDETISSMDLGNYLEDTIEFKTEQAVSKLYYGSQSESLIKINDLNDDLKKLEEELRNLKYEFQNVSSKPSNSLQERYLSEITDLEKKINAALFSIGDSELRSLFENQEEIIYTVKSGDYLGKISNAFSLGPNGVDILMTANNIEEGTYIKVGQKIKIPVGNIEKYIEWPLKSTTSVEYNRIVIKFGQRTENGVSSGIGVLPAKNEQVYPLLPGRIVETGKSANNNWYVKIDHGNAIVSMISNIKTIYVNEGDWVNNDKSLGMVEKDKIVSLELWKSGEPKDPLKLFFKVSGDFMATYYTEWDDKYLHYPTFRITKSGKIPTTWKTIAADPDVLPLGTIVYIPELKDLPNSGFFVVEDTGGKVIGNRIDIYVNDVRLAQKTEDVTIYVVGKEG